MIQHGVLICENTGTLVTHFTCPIRRPIHMRNFSLLFIAVSLLLSITRPLYSEDLKESSYSPAMQTKIAEMQKELEAHSTERLRVLSNLDTFDKLDFEVFSNQEWTKLHESHANDVVVNWPDGRRVTGLQQHIEDLKAMFVYAPDTKIKVHPVKFGSDDFTCVIGVMTGTFTKPMPAGNGKVIQPTGKQFSITMCTVGRWKNGVMIEEWLFWDNAAFMRQIGIGR